MCLRWLLVDQSTEHDLQSYLCEFELLNSIITVTALLINRLFDAYVDSIMFSIVLCLLSHVLYLMCCFGDTSMTSMSTIRRSGSELLLQVVVSYCATLL
jgi:hypothetical protein